MWKKIRRILMIVLAAVFLFCGGTVAVVQHQYAVSKRLYRAASESFTAPAQLSAQKTSETPKTEGKTSTGPNDGIFRLPEYAPIKVDFESLLKVNKDVDGWIYCPDTVIDYPVMHGLSNDTYLHHSYDRTPNASGSIFVDERNQRNFVDPVSILYGHHMADRSMFASLDEWQHQEYFDKHPVMWLLTPERDYRVELFSAYTISAYDETYTIFRGFDGEEKGPELEEYLKKMKGRSAVECDVEFDPEGLYLVLSTCAYSFEDARSVVHGKMVPVNSAGGKLLPRPSPTSP